MPTISENELAKLKNRTGIYSQLRFQNALRKTVTGLIEEAFREYAKTHKGITPEIEDRAWQRFNDILQKHL